MRGLKATFTLACENSRPSSLSARGYVYVEAVSSRYGYILFKPTQTYAVLNMLKRKHENVLSVFLAVFLISGCDVFCWRRSGDIIYSYPNDSPFCLEMAMHKIVIKFIWTEGELLVRITKEYKVANMQNMLIAVCLSPSRRSQSIEIDLTNWRQFFMRLSCYWSWISSSHCQSSCGVSSDFFDHRGTLTAGQFSWCAGPLWNPCSDYCCFVSLGFFIDAVTCGQYIVLLTKMEIQFSCRFLSWSSGVWLEMHSSLRYFLRVVRLCYYL